MAPVASSSASCAAQRRRPLPRPGGLSAGAAKPRRAQATAGAEVSTVWLTMRTEAVALFTPSSTTLLPPGMARVLPYRLETVISCLRLFCWRTGPGSRAGAFAQAGEEHRLVLAQQLPHP